jgi:hypothetical protein
MMGTSGSFLDGLKRVIPVALRAPSITLFLEKSLLTNASKKMKNWS